ncbi:DUF4395 domain-containing protein [Alkalihalobacterium chitinilyticum]|uniref:DUF4395 domain-containing protein n=1 Tax=Alkalihalobacterium chitinilyticum TaxID=2980103 RepID=A0ABT5VLC4_9BACI|nr:DUF4395 domain-containing protein [Alkalihalobacterium chitinilyticum]MDE5416238.1 DUF4395 domain-containing protein [Alkalihalobacterium chitinilyticum]
MKEIPKSYVRANQCVMVVLTVFSILLQNVSLLALTLLIVLLPLLFGPKANITFKVAKMLIKNVSNDETEAAELQRFNQTIAASLLGIALIVLLTTGHWFGWVLVGMVTVAASVALLGFCVGCFMYFQFKKMKYEMKK